MQDMHNETGKHNAEHQNIGTAQTSTKKLHKLSTLETCSTTQVARKWHVYDKTYKTEIAINLRIVRTAFKYSINVSQ